MTLRENLPEQKRWGRASDAERDSRTRDLFEGAPA